MEALIYITGSIHPPEDIAEISRIDFNAAPKTPSIPVPFGAIHMEMDEELGAQRVYIPLGENQLRQIRGAVLNHAQWYMHEFIQRFQAIENPQERAAQIVSGGLTEEGEGYVFALPFFTMLPEREKVSILERVTQLRTVDAFKSVLSDILGASFTDAVEGERRNIIAHFTNSSEYLTDKTEFQQRIGEAATRELESSQFVKGLRQKREDISDILVEHPDRIHFEIENGE